MFAPDEAGPSTPAATIDLKEEETEFFGITPVSYVDTVVNHVNDFLFDCVDIMQKKLVDEGNFSPQEVQESLDRFLLMTQSAVDKQFDLFELYVLKNIFVVRPEWNVPDGTTDDGKEITMEQVLAMKDQIKSAYAFHEELRKEQQELKRVQGVVEQVETFNAEFKKIMKASHMESWPLLAESVAQLMCDASQIRALMPQFETAIAEDRRQLGGAPLASQEMGSVSIDIEAAAEFVAAMKK